MCTTTLVLAGTPLDVDIRSRPGGGRVCEHEGRVQRSYFPAQPTVKDITWMSQQDFKLPGRAYSVDKGKEHYSVTVVDYSGIEQMGIERVKTCPAGAPLCKGTALSGPGLWKHDVREAQEYATFKLIQRDNVKVSDLTWSQHDMVEGDELQLTNTVDGL